MALTFPGLPRLLEEFSSPLDPSLFRSSVRRVFLRNSALGARSLTPETAPTPKVLIPSPVKSHPRHREIRATPSLCRALGVSNNPTWQAEAQGQEDSRGAFEGSGGTKPLFRYSRSRAHGASAANHVEAEEDEAGAMSFNGVES